MYVIIGREVSSGRKVAIKKIKVGQFKDGLDMSAIREVKFLRELKHQNVIEVCLSAETLYHRLLTELVLASRRLLIQEKLEPCARIPRYRLGACHQGPLAGLPPSRYKELDGHDVSWLGVLPS